MKETSELQKQYIKRLKEEEEEELSKNKSLIIDFKEHCLSLGLKLVDENFRYSYTIGITVSFPNIIGLLSKNIKKDKEGLVNFNSLTKNFSKRGFTGGFLYSDNYALMAHPYFRRGFYGDNSFAPSLIDLFWKQDHSNLESSIALDFNRVRIDKSPYGYMEKDMWFGASFSKEISEIQDGIVKLRPSAEVEEDMIFLMFSHAYSLDVKWETKYGIKTFQSEEFKTEEIKITVDGIKYYPVRYIHAEYDIEQKHFRHFDGAIHLYTENEYFERRDSDFNYNIKNDFHIKTRSIKLFKFNGLISVDMWIEYCSHFMTKNPLVIEYFEGKYPKHIIDAIETTRKYSKK